MKYKNGDTVKIKSYQWYNENKMGPYDDVWNTDRLFTQGMSRYCGKEMTIEGVDEELQFYYLYEDIEGYKWTDDMFDEDYEFQQAVAQAVNECLWGEDDENVVYKETDPTEKLVDDSIEFGKNVMKKKISKYLLKYLPMTPDDKEAFVEEMNKNIK